MNELTIENLDKENEITPEMIFGGEEAKGSAGSADIDSLKALLGNPTPNILDTLKNAGIPIVGNPYSEKMFEAGAEYIRNGLSVIPVGKDKRPLIPWREFQDRRATEEEFLEWLKTYPDMQLGVVTGKISNLIVVDVDSPDLDVSWLPETAQSKTGSGGKHFFYSYIEGFGNRARIKEFIDLRADGGYVIVPPSSNLKGSYEWIKKIQPVSFPKHLFEEEQMKLAEPVETEYAGSNKGQRNQDMARYIGHIVAKIHPSEWDSIAYPIIQSANQKNNPPLSEWELKNTFVSICNREKRDTSGRWYNLEPKSISEDGVKKDLFPDNDDEILTMDEAVKRQPIDYSEVYSSGIKMLDEALVGGFSSGNLIIISAQTGQGKTTMCQTLTYNLALQGLPCLWFSYEVFIADLWEKFTNMGMDKNYLCYTPLKMTSGSVDWIEKKIKEAKKKFNIKAIFIDHLGFLMPKIKAGEGIDKSSSNYALYLTRICRDLKSLALQENIMIFIPAHMRKTDDPNMNDIAYSAGVSQEADVVMVMNRELSTNEESEDYFTGHTLVTLMKVRKPRGKNLKAWFEMVNDRLVQDEHYHPEVKTKKKPFAAVRNTKYLGKDY